MLLLAAGVRLNAAFAEANRLAAAFAQEVQFGATHDAAALYLDLFNTWRMHREFSLDALATTTYAELGAGVTDQDRIAELAEWREVIDRWLDDWAVYLGDRRTHADRLRAEGDVELLLSLVDNVDVAERLTGFARVNDMESCGIPGDL